MDLQTAVDNFDRALLHCDNIIEVHRGYGGGGVGRRIKETSLDRAVVVLAVAAWQAAVQDLTTAIVDTAAPTSGGPVKLARYKASLGHAAKAIGDFATPNAENTRSLMRSVGFDPRPHWTYTIAGGQGRQRTTWTPHMVDERLNQWLKVRHAIAHGHDELPVVDVLRSVRVDGASSNATIRLVDAQQCVSFVSRLVRLTGSAIATHLGVAVTHAR
ncbi:hypothetical protein J7E29_02480 [Streptomyces sp. ISL-90]|nr:hypothetical protein [Streptomyces sp. ISL-90]